MPTSSSERKISPNYSLFINFERPFLEDCAWNLSEISSGHYIKYTSLLQGDENRRYIFMSGILTFKAIYIYSSSTTNQILRDVKYPFRMTLFFGTYFISLTFSQKRKNS